MANGLVVRQGEPTIVVAVFQNIARVSQNIREAPAVGHWHIPQHTMAIPLE